MMRGFFAGTCLVNLVGLYGPVMVHARDEYRNGSDTLSTQVIHQLDES